MATKHAPLPPGWTEHTAPTGHKYYYNASLKKSTYKRPTIESTEETPPLPTPPTQLPPQLPPNFQPPLITQTQTVVVPKTEEVVPLTEWSAETRPTKQEPKITSTARLEGAELWAKLEDRPRKKYPPPSTSI